MELTPRKTIIYRTQGGKVPFSEWFEALRDEKMQAAVDGRLVRLRLGNLGDFKSVEAGVFELRIDLGPGLRVYFGQDGRDIVILLTGGDKSTQSQDIRKAQEFW